MFITYKSFRSGSGHIMHRAPNRCITCRVWGSPRMQFQHKTRTMGASYLWIIMYCIPTYVLRVSSISLEDIRLGWQVTIFLKYTNSVQTRTSHRVLVAGQQLLKVQIASHLKLEKLSLTYKGINKGLNKTRVCHQVINLKKQWKKKKKKPFVQFSPQKKSNICNIHQRIITEKGPKPCYKGVVAKHCKIAFTNNLSLYLYSIIITCTWLHLTIHNMKDSIF